MNYETPLWTLIGVVFGFGLSLLFYLIVERIRRKKRIQETIGRVKKSMHLSDSKQAIQRIADLLPQFREEEQIEILYQVGAESSLNASARDVTKCVIGELRWICVFYEADLNYPEDLPRESISDKKRVRSIQNALWEFSVNSVEYTQSRELLRSAFDFLDVLNTYALVRRYEEVITASIGLYKDVGGLSIGIEYGINGYKILNFRFGINESIKRLSSLRESISRSSLDKFTVLRFLHAIENAIHVIEKERRERIPEQRR